jgi:hypothetical protein
LLKQRSLGLCRDSLNDPKVMGKARDTSGGVAEGGILPGKTNKDFRACSDLFNWSFDY